MTDVTTEGHNSNDPDPERIKVLRPGSFSVECRLLWAEDQQTPPPVLLSLASDRNERTRSAVGGNPAASSDLLEVLACDPDESVRWAVAANPSTPSPILTTLAHDPAGSVRGGVAGNPSASSALLERLASDPDEQVRGTVAGNPSASSEVLEELAGDLVDEVRGSVAGNLSAPRRLLKQLTRDRDEMVRDEARETLKGRDSWADVEVAAARWLEVFGPGLSADASDALNEQWDAFADTVGSASQGRPSVEQFLGWLAERGGGGFGRYVTTQDEVLRSLALHPDVESEALVSLTGYKDRRNSQLRTVATRAVVALVGRWLRRQWTPTVGDVTGLLRSTGDARALGRLLLSDPGVDPDAICAAAMCGTPPNLIVTIAGPDPESLVNSRSRGKVLASPDDWPPVVRVRLGAAASGRELDTAAASTDRWVRIGLAANPRAEHLVEQLSRDPDADVRMLAAARQEAGQAARDRKDALSESSKATSGAGDHGWVDTQALGRVAGLTERTRVVAAGHPGAPGYLLRGLAGDGSEAVRSAVESNPNTPTEVRRVLGVDAGNPMIAPEQLSELASSADSALRVSVAGNPNASPVVLEALAQDPEADVRRAVADNPTTPVAILAGLVGDEAREVRWAVAANPSTSQDAFLDLAADPDASVRMRVAGSQLATAEVLDALAGDANRHVRSRLAKNPAAPEGVLVVLAADSESQVRSDVASHPALGADLAALLAEDQEADVRRSVAANPTTPSSVLTLLCVDRDPWVKKAAAVGASAQDVSIAEDHGAEAQGLRVLAGHKSLDVRVAVAGNPSTPGDVLETLAVEERVSVRLAIAGNPSAPPAALRLLASGPFGAGQVHSAVAGNPATPPDVLEGLVRPPVTHHSYPTGLSLTHNEPCFNLAANPNTPTEALTELLEHHEGSKAVWPALAVNPAAPEAVVQRLAELGVVQVLDRPTLNGENLLTLAGRKGVTHERAVADLLVRYLNGDLAVDAELMEGLQRAGGDARRLGELIVSDPLLALDVVAAAASAGIAAKAVLNVPCADGQVLSDSATAKRVLATPAEYEEHLRLRAAASSSGTALKAAAESPDPVMRWGAAASPKAGPLLAQLVADPDQRVGATAARRVAAALG